MKRERETNYEKRKTTKQAFYLIYITEDEDIDVKVEVAIPKKNQWDDEDAEDQVKESWEDSDDEKKPEVKKAAPVIKKKVPLKQKIAEKLAAEEQKKKELEAKKLAGEDVEETEEDAFERKERMRRLELEADMANATDLFSGVSVGKVQ
jgi:translation initiation factor 3 subunit J